MDNSRHVGIPVSSCVLRNVKCIGNVFVCLGTRNGCRGNPSSSSVLCESVRYLSRADTRREFRVIIGAAVARQFNGMRRSRRLLALLLASQGFQKFFGQEGLDQDRDTLRRNRVHRLQSGVAGHHGGRYVPAKGGTQVPDGLDTIR